MVAIILLLLIFPFCLLSPASSFGVLKTGSSLSVEKTNNILISPNGVFIAGFHKVGENAFCFAIWLNTSAVPNVVWMANRNQPVNGRGSKLSILKKGNLILTDAGRSVIWSTDSYRGSSSSSARLQLRDDGNLILSNSTNHIHWQSYDWPTDTLLPLQPLTKHKELVSSRSQTNYSSGFYRLYFDDYDILRLSFDSHEFSSVYWPSPWLISWESELPLFNRSVVVAQLDRSGHLDSSDIFNAFSTDFGVDRTRRLTIDSDGNLRLYSLNDVSRQWEVTWQVISHPCTIHGICGGNSLCTYHTFSPRECSCLPGYKMKDATDWSHGCLEESPTPCDNPAAVVFIKLPNVDFYGYDHATYYNMTRESCEEKCLESCDCKAYMFEFDAGLTTHRCYLKGLLRNGHRSPNFYGTLYLKKHKANHASAEEKFELNCSEEASQQLDRNYQTQPENEVLTVLLWFAAAIGLVEILCIFTVRCLLFKQNTRSLNAVDQGYPLHGIGFRRYTYSELKNASRGFREEIGRGGGGIVYKGKLSNCRVAAIKLLNEANQGEEEFLAEVNIIGKIYHMNLIEMWGYCAEGQHRLLVYEYMEHGSVAENLFSNSLNWDKRFEIAVGTAKGLAYLHEECMEWVLHCDVKPQNILLGSDFKPRVADFGLSKLFNRGGDNNSAFSRIRGTRGYMAPEWISNVVITSKVDVYSYGIVVLELVTGRSPLEWVQVVGDGREAELLRLEAWVRGIMNRDAPVEVNLAEIADRNSNEEYDKGKLEVLVSVALQCVEEDMNERPSMRHVVELLTGHEN